MRLTAYVAREGENTMAQRTNHDDKSLVIGVLHEATNWLLTITIAPTGELQFNYQKLGQPTEWVSQLGHFDDNGTLVLHEPTTPTLAAGTNQGDTDG